MKRIHFILLSTIVVLVAACSKQTHDPVHPDTPSSSSSYIFFEPEIVETVETRAGGTSSFEGPSFGAIGYVDGDPIFTEYDNGIAEVVRDDNGLYVYSDLAQWKDATTDHNFYAFYPYDILENVSSGTVPYISYTQPTTLAAMKDVMTASTGPIQKQPLVNIQFSHRLWALDVKVHNNQTNKVEHYDPATGKNESLDPILTITCVTFEISSVPGTNYIYLDGGFGTPGAQTGLSETIVQRQAINPGDDYTVNGSQSFLFLPCSSFNYRLTIEFENAWGSEYTYHYPATYTADADGNPVLDANGNIQWDWKTTTGPNGDGFLSGSRYTLDVSKIDSTGEFTFNWVKTQWGEWDEENEKWVNVDVEHTFE